MKCRAIVYALFTITVSAVCQNQQLPPLAVPQPQEDPYRKALALEEEGKLEEAFDAFLSVPGGEWKAARLARQNPNLGKLANDSTSATALLIRADQQIAEGNHDGALERLQLAAEDYEKGYPVELGGDKQGWDGPRLAFQTGPGSQVDNWLIRRYIALEAWDLAAAEFARIQSMHDEHNADPLSLQFALDHAFFLRERGNADDALQLLGKWMLKIDLDRRPDRGNESPWAYMGQAIGISHDEYIRLAHGAFVSAKREDELVDLLGQSDVLLVKRILAKIRMHQGQVENSIALELEYIENAKFSPVAKAMRRGMIYATFDRHKDAADAFEKVLELPIEQKVDLPAPPRPPPGSAILFPRNDAAAMIDGQHAQVMALEKLEALYGALGQPEKVLTTRLKRWDINPNWTNHFERVAEMAELAKSTNQQKMFNKWADAARENEDKFGPEARANLAWVRNDQTQTTTELLKVSNFYRVDDWLKRYRDKGGDAAARQLLEGLVAANPDDNKLRLKLLELTGGELDAAELISQFEPLVQEGANPAFRYGKGVYNETQFDNYFDLTHRLFRLYVRTGQRGKMETLGLRLAAAEPPFRAPDSNSRGHHERAMAYLISESSEATLEKLAPLLEGDDDWKTARQHLAWVMAGGVKGDIERAAARPAVAHDEALIVSFENVLELARNDRFVFAAHPWGVAVYDHDGNRQHHFALDEAALHLAATDDELWIGTAIGLRRVNLETWEIGAMRCDQEISDQRRNAQDYNLPHHNGVTGLVIRDNELWIGSRQNVRRLDLETQELRIWDQRDLDSQNAEDWTQFFFGEDGKVWANAYGGCRRYDPSNDVWERPHYPMNRDKPRVIGHYQGKVWLDVYIDDQLRHRPAIVDSKTLQVEVIRISAKVDAERRKYLGDFTIYGEHRGQLVMGDGHPRFVLNPETNQLDPLPESFDRDSDLEATFIPAKERYDYWQQRYDGSIRNYGNVNGNRCVYLQLPNGAVVVGRKHSRTPRYIYPNEDWPFHAMVWEQRDNSGGLYWFRDGEPQKVTRDTIAGDTIFDALETETGTWLCTNAGITLIDSNLNIIANYGRRHGLPANRSQSVAILDGKIYFACRHDDHAGAVVVFDPDRNIFQTLTVIDGLASNAVESVKVDKQQLQVNYGVEYHRHGDTYYFQFPGTTYNPANNEFSPRPEMARFKQSEAGKRAARKRGEPMPRLGGSVIAKRQVGGQTWSLGTRGILIGDTPKLDLIALTPKVATDERREQLAEAERIRRERKLSFDERIAIDNPFVQADALTMLQPPLNENQTKRVAKFLNSPVVELRSTAAVQLYRSKTPEADNALAAVLDDSNAPIRDIAALAQTRSSKELPADALVRILSAYDTKNPKWGSTGAIGIGVDKEGVHRALAARGEAIDEEVIGIFLRFPDDYRSHDKQQPVFAKLGAAISAKPVLAKLLLTANDTRKGGQTNRDFMRDVFRFADASLLPVVHEALKSEDRIIRANAALACGALGEAESIPQLLDALDLESGLSKGAIVWALGELKAIGSIERLTELYLEAQAAEHRHYAGGVMFQQAAVVQQQERRKLASIDQLRADWDELKAAAENANAPADPRHEEPLLSPQMVLEALAKIGAEHAQPFYRARINDDRGSNGIWAAARQLGYAPEDEREASIAALRLVAANPEVGRIRAAALVSLVQLGDAEAQETVLQLLRSEESASMVYELYEKQITDKSWLDFAREELRKVANDPTANSYSRSRAQQLLR